MLLALAVFLVGLVEAMPPYQAVYYASKESPNLIYGDIMLTDEQKFIRQMPENARSKIYFVDSTNAHWPNNIVPFAFSDKHTEVDKKKLRKAMKMIEAETCFKFVKKTDKHKDYLMFEPSGSCFSYIGRTGGKQIISLYGWCADPAPAVHDIIHALGAPHEHQRTDRDKYVDVYLDNVEPNMKWVYDIDGFKVDAEQYPYDLKSIMHYHGTSYAKVKKNGESKVIMVFKGTKTPIPYNTVMSKEDIRKLNGLGKCSENNTNQPKTNKKKPKKQHIDKKTQRKTRSHQ